MKPDGHNAPTRFSQKESAAGAPSPVAWQVLRADGLPEVIDDRERNGKSAEENMRHYAAQMSSGTPKASGSPFTVRPLFAESRPSGSTESRVAG